LEGLFALASSCRCTFIQFRTYSKFAFTSQNYASCDVHRPMCICPESVQNWKINQQIRIVCLRACHKVQRTGPIPIDFVRHYGSAKTKFVVSLVSFCVEHIKPLNGIIHTSSASSYGIFFKQT
jgi:hypothetical protein